MRSLRGLAKSHLCAGRKSKPYPKPELGSSFLGDNWGTGTLGLFLRKHGDDLGVISGCKIGRWGYIGFRDVFEDPLLGQSDLHLTL